MEWLIYFATVINNLGIFCTIIGVLGISVGIFSWLSHIAHKQDKYEGFNAPWGKPLAIISAIVLFIGMLLPSRDTCYTMIAAHYGEEILNNEKVEHITGNTLDLLDTWIEQKKQEIE